MTDPEGFYLAPRILFLFLPILALVLLPGISGSVGASQDPPVQNALRDWTIPGIIKKLLDEGKNETAELLGYIWELIKRIPEMIVGTVADFIDYLVGVYKSFNDTLKDIIKKLIPEPAEDQMRDWNALNATLLLGLVRIYKLVLDLAPFA